MKRNEKATNHVFWSGMGIMRMPNHDKNEFHDGMDLELESMKMQQRLKTKRPKSDSCVCFKTLNYGR